MDRKSTSALAMLVAAGAFFQVGNSPPAPAATAETAGQPAVTSSVPSESGEGPWTPICNHFAPAPKQSEQKADISIKINGSSNGTSLKGEFSGSANTRKGTTDPEELYCVKAKHPTFRSLIVTVPDPEQTHLSLDFDRTVESIVWAIGDEGYALESYWFPWQARPDKEDPDPAKRKAIKDDREERLRKPGLLLFRCPDGQLLAVFLVGETPTSGPNRLAFGRALEGVQALTPSLREIAIVGPSFSGSLVPLARLIQEHPGAPYRIVTGRATNQSEIDQFQKTAKLAATVENDEYVLKHFTDYIAHWGPWCWQKKEGPPRIAVLSEDETAYGAGAGKNTELLLLRYPRGISRLRNSSQELPGISKPASNQEAGRQQLPLILKDRGVDTIQSFSEQLTPVSSESVLMSLAGTLRRKHIRYAGIFATDPLDAVFLSRFLRTACPDVQLFLPVSDLLLIRAAHEADLEGLLAISNYPLFLQNQDYRAEEHPPRRVQFSSGSEEGTYNACRAVLWKWESGDCPLCRAEGQPCGKRDLMLEYSSPFKVGAARTQKPSLWLSAVGHDNFWPVALLDDGPGDVKSSLIEGPPVDPTEFQVEQRSLVWVTVCILWTLFSVFNIGMIFLMNHPALEKFARVARHYDGLRGFLLPPDGLFSSRKAAHILVMFITLIVVNLLLFFPAMTVPWWEAWLFLGFMVALLGECIWVSGRAWHKVHGKNDARQLMMAAWALFLAYVGLLIWLWMRQQDVSHANYFYAYRAIHPESGLSPILPPMLLAVAYYYWGWIQLRRFRLAQERRPLLPLDPMIDGSRSLIVEPADFHDEIEDVFGFKTLLVSTPLILVWMLFFCPFPRLRTFEHRSYDLFFSLVLSVIYVMLLGNWVRFTLLWRRLRIMLQALEWHPLRSAFTRLPRTFTWTSIWRGDLKPIYLTATRSRDCLRRLAEPLREVQAHIAYLDEEERKESEGGEGEHCQHWEALETSYRNAAGELVRRVLKEHWDKGSSESVEQARLKSDNPERYEPPSGDAEERVWFAEEFLALRYLEYIRYVLLQMRNFLEFSTYGFILMVIALMVYPFEGHRALSTATIVLFAALTTGTIVVFAQMDRDPMLSRIGETKPNQLDWNFVMRLISFGGLPLVTLLGAQFPSIGNFLFSWVQPALQALK